MSMAAEKLIPGPLTDGHVGPFANGQGLSAPPAPAGSIAPGAMKYARGFSASSIEYALDGVIWMMAAHGCS